MNAQNQQYPGHCMLCKETINKGQMTRHLKKCIKNNSGEGGQTVKLFHLVVEGDHMPMYWLHVEIPGAMTLACLDAFLRDIWLECCGHLSGFTIDEQRYSVHPDEEPLFGSREKTMQQKIYKVLGAETKFQHEYDYGSTTNLKLRVAGIRHAAIRKPDISLLARNEPPTWECTKCGKPAMQIQATGWGLDPDAVFCDKCVGNDEDEGYLPIVNSPRVGVCGYTGPEPAAGELRPSTELTSTKTDSELAEPIKHAATRESHIESWHQLYTAADRIKKLAPWEWMEETDIFGVQFPGTDDVGYVSVMGTLGEHKAVSVYLGDEALRGFWGIQNSPGGPGQADRILEIPQLMASFEDREMLQKKDVTLIRELGVRYRGRQAWPLFRSYRPGYCPWFLERDEIEKLTVALEQACGMAMRFEDKPSCLRNLPDDEFLVRNPCESTDGWTWEDDIRRLSEPMPLTLTFEVDGERMAQLTESPKADTHVDVDFFVAPSAIGEPGTRPSYTYMLLAVEPDSGFILGFELLQALDGLTDMWEQIPARLADILSRAEFMPASIRTTSDRVYASSAAMLDEAGIEISLHEHLPAIDDARDSMREFMDARS